jgi:hypothetical protein
MIAIVAADPKNRLFVRHRLRMAPSIFFLFLWSQVTQPAVTLLLLDSSAIPLCYTLF